jgi:phosphatidate cytidylyltransferase
MDAPPAAMSDPAQSIPRPLPASNKRAVFARRLASTLILWGVMAAAILSGSRLIFFGLIALIGGIALVEWRRMLADSLSRATACWLYLVSAGYAASLIAEPWRFFGLHEVVAVSVLLLGLFVLEFGRAPDGRQTLWRIFSAAFGFFYIPLLLSFVWQLIEFPGVFYAFFVVAVAKFTDAGAYFFGILFGRHKMVPYISPGKTWEGLAGAFVGAFVISHGMVAAWPEQLGLLDHFHAAILAAGIASVSVLADLAESLIKRCLGVKDSGNLLPGIGGALDLIDSVLFTAPLSWVYLQILIAHRPG